MKKSREIVSFYGVFFDIGDALQISNVCQASNTHRKYFYTMSSNHVRHMKMGGGVIATIGLTISH